MADSALEPRAGTQVIDRGVLPTTEVISRVLRIQEVMKAVMQKDTHYGVIPGTQKPTLYKPGAELLLMTFRIAASPSNIEDLSTPDEVRYRVTVRGTNQVSGEIVGEMTGECSSNEEKYRWRAPVCDEEFQETDPDRRRKKWKKGYNNQPASQLQQVRTSPVDVANTILKMAIKRGLIALTLVSLGASDIFAQDLEDLTEELRESIASDDGPKEPPKQPQRKSQTGNGGNTTAAAAPKPAAARAVPEGAKFAVGVVGRTYEDKQPFAVYLEGSQTKYTTFDEKVWADIKVFAGTSHKVKLFYTETVKGDRTYFNAVGIAIADEPAAAPARAARQAAPVAVADNPDEDFDPFVDGREPGAEG